MTIQYGAQSAALYGHVAVDDADALAQWLRRQAVPAVDLGACEQVHGAALQVLLALQPRMTVPPADPLLSSVLAHLYRP
jgi:hypothetical protein